MFRTFRKHIGLTTGKPTITNTFTMAEVCSAIILKVTQETRVSCRDMLNSILSALSFYISLPPAHGGGWGYSNSSCEAIRFSPDTDVVLGGFGLYGGRGQYNVEIKVRKIGSTIT